MIPNIESLTRPPTMHLVIKTQCGGEVFFYFKVIGLNPKINPKIVPLGVNLNIFGFWVIGCHPTPKPKDCLFGWNPKIASLGLCFGYNPNP